MAGAKRVPCAAAAFVELRPETSSTQAKGEDSTSAGQPGPPGSVPSRSCKSSKTLSESAPSLRNPKPEGYPDILDWQMGWTWLDGLSIDWHIVG